MKLSEKALCVNNTKGVSPPEAEAFSRFRSAIGVISCPSSYGFQKTAYQGGQEARLLFCVIIIGANVSISI